MSNIIDKIKKIPNLYHIEGCSNQQIEKAQEALGIKFTEEFKDYVKTFGAISFYGTEWTGLNVEGYLNVVEVTKQEREFNSDFPSDCIVIENQGIDGVLVVMNETGKIFTVQYEKQDFLCDSLLKYLDICIDRK